MGWTQVDAAWRDAAIDYVDNGEDAGLRRLVEKYREQAAQDEVIASLKGEERAEVIALFRDFLRERKLTGIKASDVMVVMPTEVRVANHRGPATDESMAFNAGHIKSQRGYSDYIPVESACSGGYSKHDPCGLVAKYRMVSDDGTVVGRCERHSKKLAAERALKVVVPKYEDRWHDIGLKYAPIPIHAEDLVKQA